MILGFGWPGRRSLRPEANFLEKVSRRLLAPGLPKAQKRLEQGPKSLQQPIVGLLNSRGGGGKPHRAILGGGGGTYYRARPPSKMTGREQNRFWGGVLFYGMFPPPLSFPPPFVFL